MTRLVEPDHHVSLSDYESVAHLSVAVRTLREEARGVVPMLEGRRVWMVNSTSRGGGVAEMLPGLLTLMRDLGVDARWLVMEPDEPAFFRLTKRLHNLIHGQGDPDLDDADRELYERVSRATAEGLADHIEPGDVLVVHDPQPAGAGAQLRERTDIAAIWRCHIGLDEETPETRAAWGFLDRYLAAYDHAVFSAPEYIPAELTSRSAIIHPTIDPLSHKNRELPIHKLVGILANGSLIRPFGPVLTPPFTAPARRLQADGRWAPATEPEDIGLLFRPIITQVSRWDRLKGWLPLMEGFISLKQTLGDGAELEDRNRRSLELVRLVLAGPEPASIEDDPEAQEVVAEISAAYLALDPDLQDAIAIISLPMASEKENALLVNALQRCSDIVAQNSLREGFGLTATEAMWKHVAVMASSAAGLRQQLRPGLDGCLISDPEDRDEIARTLGELVRDQVLRGALGRSAQQRVHDEFLVFAQVRRWFEVIAQAVHARWAA
jgi:trehalose synthase